MHKSAGRGALSDRHLRRRRDLLQAAVGHASACCRSIARADAAEFVSAIAPADHERPAELDHRELRVVQLFAHPGADVQRLRLIRRSTQPEALAGPPSTGARELLVVQLCDRSFGG